MVVGAVKELIAVFTLYSGVLNFFGAERTRFHSYLSWRSDDSANAKGNFEFLRVIRYFRRKKNRKNH